MKIGVLSGSMSRLAGGLFWSVRALSMGLKGPSREVVVFAGRDRFSEEDKRAWGSADLRTFPVTGPAGFGYSSSLRAAVFDERCDLLHVHGLWMYQSIVASAWGARSAAPIVVSPRGMLDRWALRNSRSKKWVAGFAYQNHALRSAACIHALCEDEYLAIREYGLKNPVAVLPNGVDLPAPSRTRLDAGGVEIEAGKVLLFIGRIHPKKGLENLVRAWADVQRNSGQSQPGWRLVIAGWDQGGYENYLRKLCVELGVSDAVLFVGPVFGDQKAEYLRRAGAFVLPSLSEGLPMAVLEAWAYALPVVMTRECNLSVGFRKAAAIEVRPEVESLSLGLEKVLGLSQADLAEMGSRGRGLVALKFAWPRISEDMGLVYEWLVGAAPRPDFVRLD